MSAPSSPGSADSTSGSPANTPGCANTTRTAEPSSSSGSPASPSTPTSASSEPTHHQSTSSSADTPASRSASPASGKAKTTPATSGPTPPDSFAYYDPASSSLKTCQATFDSDSTLSLPTLPPWGWMSGGELYERPMSALPTSAPDSSSLLGTPIASDAMGGRTSKRSALPGETGLRGQVKALLPTPGANDMTGGEGETRKARQEKGTGGPALRDIGHLLPTPMANPANPGAGGELRDAITHGPGRRNETGVDTMGRPNEGRPSRLLPTPVVTDTTGKMLLGASTRQPLDGGKRSAEGQLQAQRTLEDA